MSDAPLGLTVGVATRDRPGPLARLLASLRPLAADLERVIVVDDGSTQDVRPALGAAGPELGPRVTLVQPGAIGMAAARNRIAELAATPYVLNLDDDVVIPGRAPLVAAVRVMDADPRVGAVAFAQADAAGNAWPAGTQAARADYPCLARTFIGFAHLLRRDVYLALGGLRATLGIYGEEREFCLRLMDAGYHVVYLPHALVPHLVDPSGRDMRRYLRLTTRNDALAAVQTDPLPLLPVTFALRLLRYFPMRRGWGVDDPGGFLRVAKEVAGLLPAAWRERTPVRLRTLARWRRIGRNPPPYPAPDAGGEG